MRPLDFFHIGLFELDQNSGIDSFLIMYNYLNFFFTVQNLYDVDFLTAYTFIYEYLKKYGNCTIKWDSDIGDIYTCFMNPKHVNNIPSNLIKNITFF